MKKIIILIMLTAVGALGAGFSQSTYPDSATLSFDHSADCDSIMAILSHPAGTIVDSVRLYPSNSSDSSICRDTLDTGLASWTAANYDISFEIWEQGEGSISAYGNGSHMRWPELFDASAGSVYVKAGIIDTVRSTENVEADSYTPDVNVAQISGSSDAADSAEKTVLGTLASYSNYQSDGDTNQVNVPDSTLIDKIVDLALADYGVNAGKTGYSLAANGLSAVVTWALIDSLADTIWVNTKFVAAIDSLGDTTWFKTHGDANWATSDGDTNQVNVPDSGSIDNIMDLAMADYGVNAGKTGYALSDAANEAIADSVLKDSSSYQGEAGSLDSATVYEAALAALQADSATVDTGAGSFAHAAVTGGSDAGSGIYACSLYVLDESDSSTVSDCWCNVRPKAGGSLLGRTTNSANAYMIFMLDAADSLQYSVYRAGWSVTIPEYITITGNQSDTIFLSEITATAPSVGKTNVTFQVQTPAGDTLANTIFMWRVVDSTGSEIKYDNHVTIGEGTNTVRISTEVHACTTQTSLFEKELRPTATMTASDGRTVYYWMFVKFPNGDIAEIDTITISGDSQNPFNR